MSQPQFRQLPVKLTDEERMTRATTAAEKQREIGQIETQKKEVSSELGRKLKDLRKEIETIQRAVLTGSEHQKVQVEERRNEERRTIETVRLDTVEVIDTRPMTFEERQGKLALEAEKKTARKPASSDAKKTPSKKKAGAKAAKKSPPKKAAAKRFGTKKKAAAKKPTTSPPKSDGAPAPAAKVTRIH